MSYICPNQVYDENCDNRYPPRCGNCDMLMEKDYFSFAFIVAILESVVILGYLIYHYA